MEGQARLNRVFAGLVGDDGSSADGLGTGGSSARTSPSASAMGPGAASVAGFFIAGRRTRGRFGRSLADSGSPSTAGAGAGTGSVMGSAAPAGGRAPEGDRCEST